MLFHWNRVTATPSGVWVAFACTGFAGRVVQQRQSFALGLSQTGLPLWFKANTGAGRRVVRGGQGTGMEPGGWLRRWPRGPPAVAPLQFVFWAGAGKD